MPISIKTQKMLWGRAASRCSFPECRRQLVLDATETDDESLVGEACHIIAHELGGPRGDSPLTEDQRDKYGNLILLCRVHHKQVDDQPLTYTPERLLDFKTDHERWVHDSLEDFDAQKQFDDEQYAGLIDEWVSRSDFDNWLAFSSWILTAVPEISEERANELRDLRLWLFSRIWPKRYPELEAAFENFRRILEDFQETFNEHADRFGEGQLRTKKFYRILEWDPPLYKKLLREFNFHVALVEDLMLELTRAANYVCDRIRQFISPAFRLKEGLIVVESGMYGDLSYRGHRVEYRGDERTSIPYPGLNNFKKDRINRDTHFGEGTDPDDPAMKVGD